jgi:hypothetical protein
MSPRLPTAALAWALALAAAAGAEPPSRGPDVPDAVVEKFQGRNGPVFAGWEAPQAVLVVTGELDGYIEPCGCPAK